MKMPALSFLFLIFLAVSCQVKSTCECINEVETEALYYDGNLISPPTSSSTEGETYTIKSKRKEADSECHTYDSQSTSDPYNGVPGYSGGKSSYKTYCSID